MSCRGGTVHGPRVWLSPPAQGGPRRRRAVLVVLRRGGTALGKRNTPPRVPRDPEPRAPLRWSHPPGPAKTHLYPLPTQAPRPMERAPRLLPTPPHGAPALLKIGMWSHPATKKGVGRGWSELFRLFFFSKFGGTFREEESGEGVEPQCTGSLCLLGAPPPLVPPGVGPPLPTRVFGPFGEGAAGGGRAPFPAERGSCGCDVGWSQGWSHRVGPPWTAARRRSFRHA
jgi:hypothetical protein